MLTQGIYVCCAILITWAALSEAQIRDEFATSLGNAPIALYGKHRQPAFPINYPVFYENPLAHKPLLSPVFNPYGVGVPFGKPRIPPTEGHRPRPQMIPPTRTPSTRPGVEPRLLGGLFGGGGLLGILLG